MRGEVLVKLITCNDVPGHWVDIGKSATKPQVSDYAMDRKHCGMTKCSISGNIGNIGILTFIEGMRHSSTHPPNVQVRPCM